MSSICSVVGCVTNSKKNIKIPLKNSSLHQFPKDIVLKNKWIDLLKFPADYEPSESSRVCAKHFDTHFFKPIRNESMYLHKNAIPNQWQPAMVSRNESKYPRPLRDNDELEEVDRIENFQELCDVLNSKNFPDWNLFIQPDGICFFRLNCDKNFNDVTFSIKILINNKMKVKIYSNGMEAKNEELDWMLKECHLQLWSQFETILDNYKKEPEIKFKASPLHHLKSAQNLLKNIIDTINANVQIKMIEDELELLIQNETPEEDFYHRCAGDVVELSMENNHELNDDPLREEIIVKIEPEPNVEFFSMEWDQESLISESDETQIKKVVQEKEKECHELAPILTANSILYRTEIIPIANSSIKSIVLYNCQKCTRKFDSEIKLKNHLDTHPFEPEKCPVESCNKMFTMRSTMKNHLWSAHNTSSSVCHICGKKFRGTKNLNAHLTTHDETTKLPCPQCGIIISKICLNKHIKTVHDKMKNYKCSHCGKEFADSYAKKLHEQRHEENKLNGTTPNKTNRLKYTYKCFKCTRKFLTKLQAQKHLEELHEIVITNIDIYCFECKAEFKDYRNHVRAHNCKFICKKCGLRFVNEHKLKDHQKSKHSENESRPHACNSCDLTFKTENHLRSHKVMIHSTQEKKFQCAVCNFKFHFKPELKIHMRVHSNDLHYKCPICSMSFKQLNAMKRHASLEHGTDEIYKCINCCEKFKTLNELKTHRQQHGVTMNVQKYFEVQSEDDQQMAVSINEINNKV